MGSIYLKGTIKPIQCTDAEARGIRNEWEMGTIRKIVPVAGASIKSSEIKLITLDEEGEKQERRIEDYTTDELKEIMGPSFEREINAASIGGFAHNDALGVARSGMIAYCLEKKIITKREKFGIEYWSVTPAYQEFSTKLRALEELNRRRSYARRMEEEAKAEQIAAAF